jgi:hypothetical protein
MSIIKNYHDKKWTFQFLNVLYNSIDYMTAHLHIAEVCAILMLNCGSMII